MRAMHRWQLSDSSVHFVQAICLRVNTGRSDTLTSRRLVCFQHICSPRHTSARPYTPFVGRYAWLAWSKICPFQRYFPSASFRILVGYSYFLTTKSGLYFDYQLFRVNYTDVFWYVLLSSSKNTAENCYSVLIGLKMFNGCRKTRFFMEIHSCLCLTLVRPRYPRELHSWPSLMSVKSMLPSIFQITIRKNLAT